MTDAQIGVKGFGGNSRSVDLWLNVTVWVLVVSILALGGWFAYTVYVTEQQKEATNAPSRLIKALEAQVRNSPNDVILRVRLGEALGSARRFPEATEQFNAALTIDPNHVGAYLDLGMVAMLTDKDVKAKAYFQKVIELTESSQYSAVDERRENALYNLGLLALKNNEYEDAAGYFKAALRIRKDASDTYLNLARALQGMDSIEAAIKQAEFAIAFDPGFAEAHYTMGQLYEQQDDAVNASYHYYQAARLVPDADLPQEALAAFGTSEEWTVKARTALEASKLDEGLKDALVARNLDPKSVDALKAHAEVLVAKRDFRNAIDVYRAGLEISDDKGVAASLAKLEREHPAEALAVYRAVLKEKPNDAELKRKVAALAKAAR